MRKIVLTGASGFVATRLIPYLTADEDVELVLISRAPKPLSKRYPNLSTYSYDELGAAAKNADILINLAALNNDQEGSESDFFDINLNLAQRTYEAAQQAGVKLFCQISTFKAADEADHSLYAKSKRAAEDWLLDRATPALPVKILRLAAVYGEDAFKGNLNIVTKAPRPLRALCLNILSCLRPVTFEGNVVTAIRSAHENTDPIEFVSTRQIHNNVYHAIKFIVDYTFALSVLILFGWLMILLWILVRLTSKGPAFFIQERIGKDKKVFKCYKYRTMRIDTPQVATHEVSHNSITKIGKFLRKSKLDELPQVLNILKRDMSLVGPRPCLPTQDALVNGRKNAGVLDILPGITGLAQISGVDMSDPDKLVTFDREYVARRTVILDLKLILGTFLGRGYGDAAKE